MRLRSLAVISTSLALLALATPAVAAPIMDPIGDFLESYTGPHGADLDIVSIAPTFDGSTFTLTSTSAGAIGSTPGGIFVWGVNRGTNATPFGAFRPGVQFDAIVLANPFGASRVVISGVATALPAANVFFSGSVLNVVVPGSLLPSAGFALSDYLVNLWPRSGAGGNSTISDFAPDNSDARVQMVPEPAAAMLLLAGLAGLMVRMRRTNPAWRRLVGEA
jgi:hypothetical protein